MRNVAEATCAGAISAGFPRVSESLYEQRANVVVREAVDRSLALAPEAHEVAVAQDTELVAHRRLGDPCHGGKVTDAEVLGDERLDDAEARGIGER